MPSAPLAVEWAPREPPLRPSAVAARGEAAVVLARRLLRLESEWLARLHGVCAPRTLVVLAAVADLPWVDGVEYLGRSAEAPALYIPACLAPVVSPSLLERAALRRVGRGPLALLPHPHPLRLVPLDGARVVSPARLREWLEGERERGERGRASA